MEIRDQDYLMRQLKELVRVLAIIQGLRKKAKFDEVEDVISLSLKNMIDLEMDVLDAVPEEDIIQVLVHEKLYPNEALKIIAELLFERGDMYWDLENQEKTRANFGKALKIYEYILEHGRTYSLDWNSKVQHIKGLFEE